MILYLWVDEPT